MGPVLPIAEMHDASHVRFEADPSKCYQRHIRELYDECENREPLPSLKEAYVERFSYKGAAALIRKYEWLKTMAHRTRACYGLKINGKLLGVACFASMGGPIRNICGVEYADKAICLARGVCVPHAPKDAASFLIPRACRLAQQDFDWQIFFAYSDPEAGEIGTIYQAINWHYLGRGVGRGADGFHVDWRSPDCTRKITSNTLNHDRDKKIFRSLGWSEAKGNPREYIRWLGWTPVRNSAKGKYVWFEGTRAERADLAARCRYPFLPYPKRKE